MFKYVEIKMYVYYFICLKKVIPCLSFSFNGLQFEHIYNCKFLGRIIYCHPNRKSYLNSSGIKIATVIGLL